MWVPIPFEQSFRMAYSRTFYGTGYYIYHQFVKGANLSRPIRSWDGQTPPDPEVVEFVKRAGSDIAPPAGSGGVLEQKGEFRLPAKGTVRVWDSSGSPRTIRALEFSVPAGQALAFSRARLKVRWDGRRDLSIDTPIALFYGTGVLYNRDNREYLVKGLPNVVQVPGRSRLSALYFPMPFFPVVQNSRAIKSAIGVSIDRSRRPSQRTFRRALEKANAWPAGTENSSARIVRGLPLESQTRTVPFAGRRNSPFCSSTPPEPAGGAMSDPARLTNSTTSGSGGVWPSQLRMGRDRFAPFTNWW